MLLDAHIAFGSVQHTHAYEDVPKFDLQAYSVEDFFAEKLRAIYQRGAASDYYRLTQLLETNYFTIDFADVGPAFDAKCKHGRLTVDLNDGLRDKQQETIRYQRGATLPDLTGDSQSFEMVWEQLDTAISQRRSLKPTFDDSVDGRWMSHLVLQYLTNNLSTLLFRWLSF